jgi:hypothetical protein
MYLPYLGHFEKLAKSDVFVYMDTLSYSKWNWFSRNKIRVKYGEGWLWLAVPVLAGGKFNQKINEVKIDNDQKWKKRHFKAIECSYSKAPYYKEYIDFFKEAYSKEWMFLSDLNEYFLRFFIKELEIQVKFIKASELKFDLDGVASDRVLDLCKKMECDMFIFGKDGKLYAKAEDFKKSNIKIVFQDFKHPEYPQVQGKFIPYMSVIDALFNIGGQETRALIT